MGPQLWQSLRPTLWLHLRPRLILPFYMAIIIMVGLMDIKDITDGLDIMEDLTFMDSMVDILIVERGQLILTLRLMLKPLLGIMDIMDIQDFMDTMDIHMDMVIMERDRKKISS